MNAITATHTRRLFQVVCMTAAAAAMIIQADRINTNVVATKPSELDTGKRLWAQFNSFDTHKLTQTHANPCKAGRQ